MCAYPAPLFHVITVGPFTKWGIDFTTCSAPSIKGHKYIIVAVDYFNKWVAAMPTIMNDGETPTLFIFSQVISHFDIPKEIITNHSNHFDNKMTDSMEILSNSSKSCLYSSSIHQLQTLLACTHKCRGLCTQISTIPRPAMHSSEGAFPSLPKCRNQSLPALPLARDYISL